MSFARKSGHFTVVEYGAAAVSAMRFRAAVSGIQCVAQGAKHGPWEGTGAAPGALRALAEELDAGDDTIFLVLARHEVTSRIMEFPSQDREELDGMVRFGASDLVPYGEHEVVTAHSVIERLDDGSSRTLVAVVHNDTLDAAIAGVREAGLKPERVLWSTACLITAIQSVDRERDDLRAFLDLGTSGFEILVMNGSRAEYTRGLGVDAGWEAGPTEEIVRELGGELRNALSSHRRESLDGLGASEVFVTSNVADAGVFARAVAEDVDYLCEPFDAAKEGIASEGELKGIPLVGWGAALTIQGAQTCAIDLTPRVELEKHARASVKTTAIRVGIAAAVMLVALGAVYFQAVSQRQSYIASLEQRVEGLRPGVRDAVNKRRHLERMQQQVERKDTVLELLSPLVDVAPRGDLNITNFRFRRGEGIELFGRAKSLKDIQNMAEALRGLGRSSIPQLAKASIAYENLTRERQKEVYDYSITVPFPQEGEETEE